MITFCIWMHVDIIKPLICVIVFFGGRVFAQHHFSRLWSVSENAHNSWTAYCIFIIWTRPVTGLQYGGEALPSPIFAGQVIIVKMLIILEPHHIFWSNFACLYILMLSRHCYAKLWKGFAEDKSGRSWPYAHNSMGRPSIGKYIYNKGHNAIWLGRFRIKIKI